MKKMVILFPYAFALYYVLNFFSLNPSLISAESFMKAVLFFFALAFVVHGAAWLTFKDKTKASLCALFFLVLFLSYLLIEEAVISFLHSMIGTEIARMVCAALIMGFFIYVIIWFKKSNSEFKVMYSFFLVFISALIIMPIFSLLQFNLAQKHFVRGEVEVPVAGKALTVEKEESPDIYHIVLDGYGRADVLEKYYDFDNSEFLEYLAEKGFIVRDNCMTNYIWTQCSVASMLSMDYLKPSDLNMNSSIYLMMDMLKNQGVGKILAEYGYNYVELASPIPTREEADIMRVYKKKTKALSYLIQITPLKYLWEEELVKGNQVVYDAWRNELLGKFDMVTRSVNKTEDPIYVFCHILLPHPPFVFSSAGDPVNPPRTFSINDCSDFLHAGGTHEEYRENYVQQLIFTNKKVQDTIDSIISCSERPTLIIISSDHGPRLLINQEKISGSQFDEAVPIFMAYRYSAGNSLQMEKINSPVNLYRVIMNCYLDTDYPILPYRFYYATWRNPLLCTEITMDVINTN